MGALIELVGVWKTYQLGKTSIDALKNISLKVNEGDFLAIMGPSGSGKSTAMNVIGCLDMPTRGKVFLEGHDTSRLPESELSHIRGKKIGFVFQMFNLISTLTAAENITLPMIFQDIPREERGKKAYELLELVGLRERATHAPNELSGGEQQRIAIARSLANNPAIVLADEPTGNLDSKTGQSIMEMLVNLHKKQHKTIVVVTHDMRIAKYAKRVVNLIDGQVAHDHGIAKRFLWKEKKKKVRKIKKI